MTLYTIRERFNLGKPWAVGFRDICTIRSYTLARVIQWILIKATRKFIVVVYPA